MIKQTGLLLRGRPILLITRMITDQIGLHSVLLPLLLLLLLIIIIVPENSHHRHHRHHRHQSKLLECGVARLIN